MDTGVLSAGQNMTSVTTCASIGIGSGQSMMAGQSASQIQVDVYFNSFTILFHDIFFSLYRIIFSV